METFFLPNHGFHPFIWSSLNMIHPQFCVNILLCRLIRVVEVFYHGTVWLLRSPTEKGQLAPMSPGDSVSLELLHLLKVKAGPLYVLHSRSPTSFSRRNCFLGGQRQPVAAFWGLCHLRATVLASGHETWLISKYVYKGADWFLDLLS